MVDFDLNFVGGLSLRPSTKTVNRVLPTQVAVLGEGFYPGPFDEVPCSSKIGLQIPEVGPQGPRLSVPFLSPVVSALSE